MEEKFDKIITHKPGLSWEIAIEELHRRREAARQMGGKDNVARQHSLGKLTIRERIDKMLDPGTFFEVGGLMGKSEYDENGDIVGFTPAAMVMGFGELDGRSVTVSGEDFTVAGGSPIGTHKDREMFVSPMSVQYGIPMIQLLDGAGANAGQSLAQGRTRLGTPARRWWNTEVMNNVPVVSAILGPSAGHVAGDAMFCHFSVMNRHTASIFPAGPPVVARALSYSINKHDLGGADMHVRMTGVVDNEAASEEECFKQIKQFLSYMPDNKWEVPARKETGDDPNRCAEELLNIVPIERKRSYNIYKVIRLIVDNGEFFEMRKYYGGGIVTVFARMDGYTVGLIANNPMVNAGAIDGHAAQKMARFSDLCNMFNIPVVLLSDTPGFMIGVESEKIGTLRYGVSAIAAAQEATVPKVHIIIRKMYGMGGTAWNSMGGMLGLDLRFAWPSAEWGAIPIEGGVTAAFKKVIESAPDPEAKRKELEGQLVALRSPFRGAEAGDLMDIIDPRESRPIICRFIKACQPALLRHAAQNNRTVRPA